MGNEGGGQTIGERIYLIREALGSRRDPMPLEQFAALIQEQTGVRYDKSVLSRKETGGIAVNLDDITAIAAVDPLKRGRSWLAWGREDEQGGQGAKNGDPAPKPAPTRRPIIEVPVHVETLGRPPAKRPAKRRRPPTDRTARAS